jgi:hypothetical protein
MDSNAERFNLTLQHSDAHCRSDSLFQFSRLCASSLDVHPSPLYGNIKEVPAELLQESRIAVPLSTQLVHLMMAN